MILLCCHPRLKAQRAPHSDRNPPDNRKINWRRVSPDPVSTPPSRPPPPSASRAFSRAVSIRIGSAQSPRPRIRRSRQDPEPTTSKKKSFLIVLLLSPFSFRSPLERFLLKNQSTLDQHFISLSFSPRSGLFFSILLPDGYKDTQPVYT